MTLTTRKPGLVALLPARRQPQAIPVGRKSASDAWMTQAIRRNMGVRARRLMRSGD